MQSPLQITFREMEPSVAIEEKIREKAAKLEQYFPEIIGCHVRIGALHRHHHQGKVYHVGVDIKVPNDEIVVSREPELNHAHEDVYVAIRDSFDKARRQLEDYGRRQRGQTKTHEMPLHGRISEIHPSQGYGRLETGDGREVYFHKNSVIHGDFEKLRVGSEVRFAEEKGEKGLQASNVIPIGKHHLLP